MKEFIMENMPDGMTFAQAIGPVYDRMWDGEPVFGKYRLKQRYDRNACPYSVVSAESQDEIEKFRTLADAVEWLMAKVPFSSVQHCVAHIVNDCRGKRRKLSNAGNAGRMVRVLGYKFIHN